MYKFEICLTEQDYLSFNNYHVINSQAGKKALRATKFLYVILSLLVVLIFYITKKNFNLFVIQAALMMIVSVLGIVFTKKITLSNVKRQIKALKKSGRLPYSTASTVMFDENCIHEITQSSESKTDYSLVEKIVTVSNAVYVYFSAVQAYIIPERCFSSEEEKQAFINFLKENTKAAVLLSK